MNKSSYDISKRKISLVQQNLIADVQIVKKLYWNTAMASSKFKIEH